MAARATSMATATASTDATPDAILTHLDNLPVEISEMVMLHLPVLDLLNASNTCRSLRDIVANSSSLQDAIRFKRGPNKAIQERKWWTWGNSTGLRPSSNPDSRPRKQYADYETYAIKIFNTAIATRATLIDRQLYDKATPMRKVTYQDRIWLRPETWRKDIDPKATCLDMQITQPPSTELHFMSFIPIGDDPRDGHYRDHQIIHQSGIKIHSDFTTIRNDKGITLGDVRAQAKEHLGKSAVLFNFPVFGVERMDWDMRDMSDLFLPEELIEWVEGKFARAKNGVR